MLLFGRVITFSNTYFANIFVSEGLVDVSVVVVEGPVWGVMPGSSEGGFISFNDGADPVIHFSFYAI